jgi:hypothetical protein
MGSVVMDLETGQLVGLMVGALAAAQVVWKLLEWVLDHVVLPRVRRGNGDASDRFTAALRDLLVELAKSQTAVAHEVAALIETAMREYRAEARTARDQALRSEGKLDVILSRLR